jgi:ESS family glutamate:Na+ symporter
MDFSSNNTLLWNAVVQVGIIAGILLLANLMRRKIAFVRKTFIPTSVLGGFLLLFIRISGVIAIDAKFLEMVTYHAIAIGFIALSLRTAGRPKMADSLTAPKSGALIVSTYVVQGILGLVISIGLAYTIKPDFFKAAGVLLPMGYGQGPGQANNIGTAYENLGFAGGRSFGLSIAAAGFLVACVVGVFYINILYRKGLVKKTDCAEISGSVTTEVFEDKDEIPLSESIDKFSVQMAMVLLVYLLTYLVTRGIAFLAGLAGAGIEKTVGPLLWGFNFIIGSILAFAVRAALARLRRANVMTRQYQNNYLLSRISGLAFDLMIIGGIAIIEFSDLRGLWLPFILMAVAGAIVTLYYLKWLCKIVYPGYYLEGLLSMYGMPTGTISSGVLLLREIDPSYQTPAANNLVSGSAFGILFGFPMLILIGLAPQSTALTFIVLGLLVVYLAFLLIFMLKAKTKKQAQT